MLITRVSPVTLAENTREIDITQDQLDNWQAGALIQDVASHLSADDREFLISGSTPEDWNALFGDEEEDY